MRRPVRLLRTDGPSRPRNVSQRNPNFAFLARACDNRSMLRVLLPALLAALFAVTACGGGSDSASPTPTPSPTIDFGAVARDAAADALVTLDELPQFWIEGTDEDLTVELDLSPDCDVLDPDVAFPGAVATDQSPVHLGTGERQATFLTAAFRTEADAAAVLPAQDALVDRCYDEFLDAIDQAARDAAADQGVDLGVIGQIDVSLGPTAFPTLGDETGARRASVSVVVVFVSTDFDVDIIVVRSGRMIGVMTYSNYGFINSEEEETIARAMLAKLSAADAALPD